MVSALTPKKIETITEERDLIYPRTSIGNGNVMQIGEEAAWLKLDRVVLITTSGFTDRDGGIVSLLYRKGIEVNVFNEVEPEPSVATAEKALSFVKENWRGDTIGVIGIGGGSALDVAKAVAAAATNGGLAACKGISKISASTLPLILVPTTSGTGSEATPVSVLIDSERKKFVIYSKHLLPNLAIVDPELTYTMPEDVTVYSGMDAMCHAVESYLSVNANHFSEATSLAAAGLMSDAIVGVKVNPNDRIARYNMSLGSHFAGAAMTNSGCIIDGCPIAGAGITHAIGLATGARYRIPHGLSVGMVLPYAMDSLKDTSETKLKLLGEAFGAGQSANGAIARMFGIMDDIEMPRTVLEYLRKKDETAKIDVQADIQGLVDDAFAAQRLLANCSRKIGKEDLRGIIERILC